jgi:hypothetical protein
MKRSKTYTPELREEAVSASLAVRQGFTYILFLVSNAVQTRRIERRQTPLFRQAAFGQKQP